MVIVGGGLGDDLHLAAAGPVVLRRIGILVDAHFLHGRGGDGGAIGFDTVDDQARAAGRGGAVIEESAHGGGVVVVEDGKRLQIAGNVITEESWLSSDAVRSLVGVGVDAARWSKARRWGE